MQRNSILANLAKRIRELRRVNSLSQEQLAEKANLHPTFIGSIERAEKNPTITSLEKIAKALNVTIPELLTFGDVKLIANADKKTINQAITILKQMLKQLEGYSDDKQAKMPR